MSETIAEILGYYVEELSYEKLPLEVRQKVKELLIDWIACAISGSAHKYVDSIIKVMGKCDGRSTILGRWLKTGAASAAFLNSFMSHILEMDDVHMGGIIHLGSVVFPAALSVSEDFDMDGKTFITSAVAGYEVGARLAIAAGREHYKIWHTTGTCGSFSACIAASKVLGLDREAISRCLGIAGSFTSGLWEFITVGSDLKPFSPAHASWLGVISAYLGKGGMKGPKTIFEGRRGFFKAFNIKKNIKNLFTDFTRKYEILNVSMKPYPSCRHTHSAIDAALEVRGDIDISDISEIIVETYSEAINISGLRSPKDINEAKFSLSHCVAATLVYGPLTYDLLEKSLKDPIVKNLERIIKVIINPRFDDIVPEFQPAKISIKLRDGSKREAFIKYPKGDPRNPMKADEIEAKFLTLTQSHLKLEDARELLIKLHFIEKFKISELFNFKPKI